MIGGRCPVTFAVLPDTIEPGTHYLDIGAAIEALLLIWLATEPEEWVEQLGFVPV